MQAAVNSCRLATSRAPTAKAQANAAPPATIQTSMALSPLHDQLGLIRWVRILAGCRKPVWAVRPRILVGAVEHPFERWQAGNPSPATIWQAFGFDRLQSGVD